MGGRKIPIGSMSWSMSHCLEDLSTSWVKTCLRGNAHVRIYSDGGAHFKVDPKDPTFYTDLNNRVQVKPDNLTGGIARVLHTCKFSLPEINPKIVTLGLFDRAWTGVKEKKRQDLNKLDLGKTPPLDFTIDGCLSRFPAHDHPS